MAIYSGIAGSVIEDSTFEACSASHSTGGAGCVNVAGTDVTIRDSTFSGNVSIHDSSNAPFIDFVESGATSDSKARITMDQVDGSNGQLIFSTENAGSLVLDPGMSFRIITTISLVAGTTFLMWLGEQITLRGVGNGISLIIFSGIVAEIPRALASTFELGRTGALSAMLIVIIFILVIFTVLFIVFFERAMRKILINYPKRQMGNKVYGGESSHLPLKINTAGVIPAIFASALLLLPVTLANFGFSDSDTFINISSMFTQGQPLYMLLYASGIIFFSFFYTSIVFNPKETAENLRKYGGFIPGIRPGERSAEYIETILNRLTTIGAMYLTFVCLLPEFLISKYPIPFYLGGTSILIVVVVAMDTVTQVQTRMMSSQYESLIKKSKFGK